jgi:hypothetical protein
MDPAPEDIEFMTPELRERINAFIDEVGEQCLWIVLNERNQLPPLTFPRAPAAPLEQGHSVDPRLFESTAMLLHLAAQALKERA